jgi:hypothetical protein
MLTDPVALAEAHYHAYRAALQRRDWSKALTSYEDAASLDPDNWPFRRLLAELGATVPAVPHEIIARARKTSSVG